MKTRVSEKGQITIPKPLRDRLGIRVGQILEVAVDREGRLIATKVSPRRASDELYGSLDLGNSTDEIMRDLRGDRSDLLP